MRRVAVAAVVLALGLAASSCRVQGKRAPYEQVGPAAATLRKAFNDDVSKVRVLALVAPT